MTATNVLYAWGGWQAAITLRLAADFVWDVVDERRRKARAAARAEERTAT